MRPISRREFMRAGTGALAAAALGTGALERAMAAEGPRRRPNIVVVITDDQRFDAMGCMGHPFLKTPHLDRLRREGVLLANAFVTTSLCSPSRASFLTGTYAHTHGVMLNATNDYDPARTPSFCQLLRDRGGYRTAFVGKWHLDSERDDPREGFDHWVSFKGQGVYFDPEINENGQRSKQAGYITDILTDHADRWIRQEAGGGRPFCLYLAHKAVHAPFQPAPRHEGACADARIDPPASFDDPRRGKPAWKRTNYGSPLRLRSSVRVEPVDEMPRRPWKPAGHYRRYMESILAVDEGVGRLLDTLDELGIADDTVVVFASDNGYFLGDNGGRGDKRLCYEASMRIPLLLRYPRLATAGGTVDRMVLNIDLAPTLLDLAGVSPAPVMQGMSAAPLLAGKTAGWRTSFLYEYWRDLTPVVPRMVCVRTDRWKYTRYPDIDQHELYDLQADPHEMTNLADAPGHAGRVAELRAELERLMRETGYKAQALHATSPKPRGLVAAWTFDAISDGRVADASGNGNHGRVSGAAAAAGRRGTALRFTGSQSFTVAPSDSLDPAFAPWIVEAWVKADGDGIICAHGGERLGYALFVDQGVPGFSVRDGQAVFVADGRESCLGRWTHLAGVIDETHAHLYVDGRPTGSIPLMHLLRACPTDPLSLGADTGSPVDPAVSAVGFHGLIDSVRIHRRDGGGDTVAALMNE
ncbi:MAG: sulfatase-like hydrolase/transferase [Planctomycetes bacterium]|nr:sulfatase-like hydrolase/transferase [Planctomycetota bacterium]